MARFSRQYQAFVSPPEDQRHYQQERLIFEATELLSRIMENENLSRTQLASRLGKSKAFVTQTLRGSTNMTLRTLADLAWTLGYSVELSATSLQTSQRVGAAAWRGYFSTAMRVASLPFHKAILELSPHLGPEISAEAGVILEEVA